MRKLLTDMIFYTQVADNVFMNLFLVHKVILCTKKKVHKTLIINHLGIKFVILLFKQNIITKYKSYESISNLFRIKYKFPDVDMTIVADKFSPNTTSDIGKNCLG